MKVLLYTEGIKTIGKSGLGKALKHQIKALEDNNIEYQTINVGNINTNSVKIIIEEVYTDGRVYQDTCISEVAIYGQSL